MKEFLKFCLHFDTGLSRALSSVLILIWDFLLVVFLIWDSLPRAILSSVVFLIWDYLPRTFCSFSYKVQLLFLGKMAVLVLMLNLRWNGLNFSRPPQ